MAGIRILSSHDVEIRTSIPKPVIIYADMGLQEWKQCFSRKKCETTDPTEKIAYDKCLKIIMWAEFCEGTLTKVGNFKTENGMNITLTFWFPTLALRTYFDRNVEKNINSVTNPAQYIRTTL